MGKKLLDGLSAKQSQKTIVKLSGTDNRGLKSNQLNKNIKPLNESKQIKPPKGDK